VIRRGNITAFELLVSRYESRLLSFCRHLLRSREDAEDVMQEVLASAYNAMLSDDRPINVRPWLYRIARNRCLNHLRKAQAVGVDSMDVHFSDNGASTADKAHDREEFRQLVGDIHGLPETQRTALVLREMDALSYEQIAEAMDTTVPSVKSLLVRARVSLAEAAESRLLTCEEVREQLAEVAEGLVKKANPAVRRHVKSCSRCGRFGKEMRHSSKALAGALVPISAVAMLRKVLLAHLLGHSASSGAAGAAGASATGTGAVASAAGASAAGAGAGAAGVAAGGSAGLISAGVGAVATKAAAGLAAAALVTAGTVAVSHAHHHAHQPTGLQVLTTSVNAGVARSDAIAPRLAAPVQAMPAAQPAQALKQVARVVTPKRTVTAPLAAAAAIVPSTPATAAAGQAAAAGSATAASPAGAAASPAVVASPAGTGAPSPSPTATVASATTPTTTTPIATAASVGTPALTSTSPATTTTPTTTATGTTTTSTTPTTTTTTPAETTTTPASTTPTTTSTAPASPPASGGIGLTPSSPATTVVAPASPLHSS
jgi:RNA polymerase sigma factor (sigma-70 family)